MENPAVSSPSSPRPARGGRRWLVLTALVVVLLLAGFFTYSRLTAGIGHHPGDTITYSMPGGGTVSFTLQSATQLPGDAPAPRGMRPYAARVLVVNHTSASLNITSAQFAAGPTATDANPYPPAPPCFQEIAPGASLVCDLHFTLPQDIAHPVLYWLPDGAGNTANVWWYLAA